MLLLGGHEIYFPLKIYLPQDSSSIVFQLEQMWKQEEAGQAKPICLHDNPEFWRTLRLKLVRSTRFRFAHFLLRAPSGRLEASVNSQGSP